MNPTADGSPPLRQKRLWPRSLRGQMVALVLVGLGLAQVLGFVIYRSQQRSELQALRDEFVLTRIVSVARLLADTPPALHPRIVQTAGSRSLRLALAAQAAPDSPSADPRAARLRQKLAAQSGVELTDVHVDLRYAESARSQQYKHDDDDHRRARRNRDRRDRDDDRRRSNRTRTVVMTVALRLGPGRWLNVTAAGKPPEPFWQWPTLLSAGLAALILSGLMVAAVRRITRPLAGLAAAAERFGRGEATVPLAERGPADVRDTIRAFNHMRARLERFVQDRTQMLAAISHDLRTPIAALRVRAELIEAPDTRGRILATLDEMQRMTEATLTFVREDADRELTRPVDLNALVESLCDDLSDTGADVRFSGPGKTPYRCRSLSLKRALRNVIENATRYGERARVKLSQDADGLRIQVADDGPGIAETDRERVFEPFVRLEASRSLETGGVGLGLAIARSIVRRHGGDIVLENQTPNGLIVTVILPRVAAVSLFRDKP